MRKLFATTLAHEVHIVGKDVWRKNLLYSGDQLLQLDLRFHEGPIGNQALLKGCHEHENNKDDPETSSTLMALKEG